MVEAVHCFGGDAVPVARALAEGAALAASLADDRPRVAVYGAGLAGSSVVLGAWQRRASVPVASGEVVARRRTGGVACRIGDGVVYVALALRTASELMACPRDRVLNRNVRPLLAGLGADGVPAHYFGRDVLSVAHRPVALVGWDRDTDGRVLVEALIARTRVLELVGATETWRGKMPITLTEAGSREPSAADVVRNIVERGLRSVSFSEAVAPAFGSVADDERTLHWSPPVAIPIGFAEAGLAVDDAGRITDVRLAGDFMQDRDAPARLAARLVGHAPDRTTFAGALNATYGAGGDAVIEGVRSLESLLDALVLAADHG